MQQQQQQINYIPDPGQCLQAILKVMAKNPGSEIQEAAEAVRELFLTNAGFTDIQKQQASHNVDMALQIHVGRSAPPQPAIIATQPVAAQPAPVTTIQQHTQIQPITTQIQYREPTSMPVPANPAPAQIAQQSVQQPAQQVTQLKTKRAGTSAIQVNSIDKLGSLIQQAWMESLKLDKEAIKYIGGEVVPSADVPRWFRFRYWRKIGKTSFPALLRSRDDLVQMGAPKSIHISQEVGEVNVLITNPACPNDAYLWLHHAIDEHYQSPTENPRIKVGVTTTGEILEFELIHCLVGGMPGQGKSSMQAMILSQLMAMNAPRPLRDQRGVSAGLRIVIVETSKKVEAAKFEGSAFLWNGQDGIHPTMRPDEETTGIIQTKEEFIAAISEGGCLYQLYTYREKLFGLNGVQNIGQWNARYPSQLMFRVVVSIEEYSSMIQEEQPSKDPLHPKLGKFMEQCRAFGIHFIIGCHRPEPKILDDRIRAAIQTRISMACATDRNYRVVLGMTDDTKTPIPNLPGRGTAIVRNGNGPLDIVQAFYISDEQIASMIENTNYLYRRT